MELPLAIAGMLQLGVASANFVAVKKLRYPQAVAALPDSVRRVFWVQNVYLVLTVVGAALACFFSPEELSAGDGLGRGLSGFLALFWGSRLGVQLFYYSPAERRRHRAIDLLFLGTFLYLTGVFAAATIGR